MVASFKSWWGAHSTGERWIMGALGTAIFVVFLWLGVWRPVTDGLNAGWERQGQALDRYSSVRAKIDALKHLPAASPAAATPIDQLVSQSAAEAGFTLDRVGTAGAGRMSLSIASARTGPLLGWLSQLEASGVGVQSINIVPGVTDGTVAVQAVLQERAP